MRFRPHDDPVVQSLSAFFARVGYPAVRAHLLWRTDLERQLALLELERGRGGKSRRRKARGDGDGGVGRGQNGHFQGEYAG